MHNYPTGVQSLRRAWPGGQGVAAVAASGSSADCRRKHWSGVAWRRQGDKTDYFGAEALWLAEQNS